MIRIFFFKFFGSISLISSALQFIVLKSCTEIKVAVLSKFAKNFTFHVLHMCNRVFFQPLSLPSLVYRFYESFFYMKPLALSRPWEFENALTSFYHTIVDWSK